MTLFGKGPVEDNQSYEQRLEKQRLELQNWARVIGITQWVIEQNPADMATHLYVKISDKALRAYGVSGEEISDIVFEWYETKDTKVEISASQCQCAQTCQCK